MRIRNAIIVVLAMIVALACTAIAKDNSMGIAQKHTISFSAPTIVGGTVLPAGNYSVTHEMNGQTHVMIFKEIGGTKAEAKTNCNLVPLKDKAEQTQMLYTTNAKNEHVLQQMTFEGDKATHVLTQ